MSPQPSLPPLRGAPARVFVSLDESTSRSTLSFAVSSTGGCGGAGGRSASSSGS